jgi:hypothetical protein
MPFGLFGPIKFQTKRGTRVTFFAGFITLPLTAWSLYHIFDTSAQRNSNQGHIEKQPTDATGVDVSDH